MYENWSKSTGKGTAPAGEHHIKEISKFYGNIDEINTANNVFGCFMFPYKENSITI
jgi:hypothetical protein